VAAARKVQTGPGGGCRRTPPTRVKYLLLQPILLVYTACTAYTTIVHRFYSLYFYFTLLAQPIPRLFAACTAYNNNLHCFPGAKKIIYRFCRRAGCFISKKRTNRAGGGFGSGGCGSPASAVISRPDTRHPNPELKTRNMKHEPRNPELEALNQKSEARNLKCETRKTGPEYETLDQKPETRHQTPEARNSEHVFSALNKKNRNAKP